MLNNSKVAMIGLRGIPSKDGGVEVAVGELAPRLVSLGLKVVVYCRNPYVQSRPKKYKGVELIYLPTINNKHFEAFIHTMLSTLHALIINKTDIIHYHALGNALFTSIPKMLGKRVVVTIHGFDYEREKWSQLAKKVLKSATSSRLISRPLRSVAPPARRAAPSPCAPARDPSLRSDR